MNGSVVVLFSHVQNSSSSLLPGSCITYSSTLSDQKWTESREGEHDIAYELRGWQRGNSSSRSRRGCGSRGCRVWVGGVWGWAGGGGGG